MNRGTYTAATGMIAQQRRMDVMANNLANVNTRGFKADGLSFRDMMVRTMANGGGYGETIGLLPSGPTAVDETTDMSQGAAEHTGNAFDFMLQGEGMFQVQTPAGVRYTRDGSFTLSNGALVTKNGDAVLDGEGKPIVGLQDPVKVSDGGQITSQGRTISLGRSTGAFLKDPQGKNLYTSADAKTADVPVKNGFLETANVEPIDLMVQMIALQRGYEISQKMIQSQDESTAKLAETMS